MTPNNHGVIGNRAAIIRLCTQSFVEHFEKTGGTSLPLNFREIMACSDNRTTESKTIRSCKTGGRDKMDRLEAEKSDGDYPLMTSS